MCVCVFECIESSNVVVLCHDIYVDLTLICCLSPMLVPTASFLTD